MIDIAHGEINVEWFDNVLISAPLGPINGCRSKDVCGKNLHFDH